MGTLNGYGQSCEIQTVHQCIAIQQNKFSVASSSTINFLYMDFIAVQEEIFQTYTAL